MIPEENDEVLCGLDDSTIDVAGASPSLVRTHMPSIGHAGMAADGRACAAEVICPICDSVRRLLARIMRRPHSPDKGRALFALLVNNAR